MCRLRNASTLTWHGINKVSERCAFPPHPLINFAVLSLSDGSEDEDGHQHTGYTDICIPTANIQEVILGLLLHDHCLRRKHSGATAKHRRCGRYGCAREA